MIVLATPKSSLANQKLAQPWGLIRETQPLLANHGFQFTLKYLMLRSILTENHWLKKDTGISYLDDLLYHCDIINEPNYVKCLADNPVVFFDSSDVLNRNPESFEFAELEFPNSFTTGNVYHGLDPLLLDPVVVLCNSNSFSAGFESTEDVFTHYRLKNHKTFRHVQDNFVINTSNAFEALVVVNDNLNGDGGLFDNPEHLANLSNEMNGTISSLDCIEGAGSLDSSYSNSFRLVQPDDLHAVVLNFVEQEPMVLDIIDPNISVVCSSLDEENYFDNILDHSESSLLHPAVLENFPVLSDDVFLTDYSAELYFFETSFCLSEPNPSFGSSSNHTNTLDWALRSDEVDVVAEKEALVDLDFLRENTNVFEMPISECPVVMHSCSDDTQCCYVVPMENNGNKNQRKVAGPESGSSPVPYSPSSNRGRHKKSAAPSGTVRRSAMICKCQPQSTGELPGLSATSGTSNLGSGMSLFMGSTYSTYALGNLSSAEFCQLASATSFIFTDVEIDREFIRCKELERDSNVGI